MKERRGTMARLAGLAEGVAAASRRRGRERAPRVLLYDAEGEPRRLLPDAATFEDVVSAAERMLELGARARQGSAEGEDPARPSSTGGVSFPATELDPDREADARGGTRDEG
ncbi:MAG: hypothetical protein H0X55_03490 [Thermoleophilaceae bacterium]|nr:hypothetical protein [Thermoleophilaceae bacterium]